MMKTNSNVLSIVQLSSVSGGLTVPQPRRPGPASELLDRVNPGPTFPPPRFPSPFDPASGPTIGVPLGTPIRK